MFAKGSRYRTLPDIVTLDAEGRCLQSKDLRLTPRVSGTFLHTVESIDRLDHLAYKYYKQPRKWWRICDANPGYLSPLALLGQDPVAMARFPLDFSGTESPPWSALIEVLSATVGVYDVKLLVEARLVEEQQTEADQKVTFTVEQRQYDLGITYNSVNCDLNALVEKIKKAGFKPRATPEPIGRVGKTLAIPPDGAR